MNRRTMALVVVLAPLVAGFVFVALRSGPLAPVPVVVAPVESRPLTPALFGIGTVQARYTYPIGPTVTGRVRRLEVEVGEHVDAGQLLGEIDPVDLDDRIVAQQAALLGAQANVLAAEAQVREAEARKAFAQTQAQRYERLLKAGSISEEARETHEQTLQVAAAGWTAATAQLEAARQAVANAQAGLEGLEAQRQNLNLVAPVAGLVTARRADPGGTVIAGSPVIELVDPTSLWLHVRFDQASADGLRPGLPTRIALRSRPGQVLSGRVERLEPLADAVTEEVLVKVAFDTLPDPLPPLGELAEATVSLTARQATPVVLNASLQRVAGQLGVWVVESGSIRFTPVIVGIADLDGRIQILEGLRPGERVVVYSQRPLTTRSRIKVVERLPGTGS